MRVTPITPDYTLKRIFDLIFSFFLLLFAFPVILLTAILIRMKMGKPVFYLQLRPGYLGKPFQLIKFRTMLHPTIHNDNKIKNDALRMTPLGSFLRNTSLDELPELVNVIKGDMSIVGPRPLLMQYLQRYSQFQMRRHEVRPGITGWAQVNGRNTITWEERFALDVWYVENRSLMLDIKIILMTIKKVLIREGISAEGDATMPEFMGNNHSVN
jgi:lipopolysaccharide/colanic/teichoic acid biosynthesis glycosyltransferase